MENSGLTEEVEFDTSRNLQDVETDLGAIEGVRSVTCDQENGKVRVAFDPTTVDTNRLRTIVEGGSSQTSLIGDLPAGNAQPVAGLDAAYGGVDRSPATQGQPPANTV